MHVGFNSSTGEFTGIPKEWQQLLQESDITRQEQENNTQATMEVVKFYQETHAQGDQVWDKLGNVPTQSLAPQTPNTPGIFPGGILSSGPPPPSSFQASRPAPAPPGGGGGSRKPSIGASGAPGAAPLSLQSYRPAPTPPSTVPPALERSNSAHTSPKFPTAIDQLARAKTVPCRTIEIDAPLHYCNECGRVTTSRVAPTPPTGESARTHERLQAICTTPTRRNLAKIG